MRSRSVNEASLPVPSRHPWKIYTMRARRDTLSAARQRRTQRTLGLALQLQIILVGRREAQETDRVGACEHRQGGVALAHGMEQRVFVRAADAELAGALHAAQLRMEEALLLVSLIPATC